LTFFRSASARTPALLALAVFGATFSVYALTAARTLSWGDSAEFVAVASTLGISHPPGYPLYTLLGALAVRVPLGTPFLRMSLLSALFASGAAAAASLIVWVLSGARARARAAGVLPRLAGSLLAGGAVAFGPTWWSQAVVPEVYSMSVFLSLAALLLFACWSGYRGLTGEEGRQTGLPGLLLGDRPVVVGGLVAGLALAHHLTAVFLLVPLALGVLGVRRRPSAGATLAALGLLVVGLSLYAYLPLRAAQGPAILWAPINTLGRFVDHVTGAQYAPLLFSAPLVEVLHKLSAFAGSVPGEITWVAIALAVPGIVSLFTRARGVAVALIVWALLVVGHAAVYRIPDIESYYMPVYAALSVLAGAGLSALASARWWKRAATPVAWLAVALALAVPVLQARDNWATCDWSGRDDGSIYLDRLVDSIEPGGILMTMTDRVLFPLWYARFAGSGRDDFAVACVREHAPHLERWNPGVRFPSEDELCSGFESPAPAPGAPARESIPLGHYLPLFVSLNSAERRIYADADLARRVFPDRSVARGLLVEITEAPADSTPPEAVAAQDAFWTKALHELGTGESTFAPTAEVYAITLAEQGMLMLERGEVERALDALERACAMAPDVPLCHSNLGVAYERIGRRDDALAEFETAIALNPGLAVPHHNISVAARRSGDIERARHELELAIALAPRNPSFKIELAGLYEERSEFGEAERVLRSALGPSDDEWSASLAYGDFLRRRRRYAEAVGAYQHAEALRPGSTGALRGLGRCYWALEDRERALEVTRRLVELQPRNPAIKFDLALMLQRSGRGREAVALLDDVIRLLPGMWEARALKASILAELGRHWEARSLFEQADDLGASGHLFWESWAATEAALGDGKRESEVRQRAARANGVLGGAPPDEVAE
jgi:Flp pilus assembly protein TadD